MARRFKKWIKLRNTHFYINENKVEGIKETKQHEKTEWRVIGEASNRQSKYEIQSLLFEIYDYVGINKNNNENK